MTHRDRALIAFMTIAFVVAALLRHRETACIAACDDDAVCVAGCLP